MPFSQTAAVTAWNEITVGGWVIVMADVGRAWPVRLGRARLSVPDASAIIFRAFDAMGGLDIGVSSVKRLTTTQSSVGTDADLAALTAILDAMQELRTRPPFAPATVPRPPFAPATVGGIGSGRTRRR